MEEEWRPTHISDDFQVSNFGRVRCRVRRKGLRNPVGEWTICPLNQSTGYHSIIIKRTKRLVHNLVLSAFVRPPEPGEEACHYPDPTRTNNNLNNLRWASASENSRDCAMMGKRVGQKLLPEQVLEIRQKLPLSELTSLSAKRVADEYNVSPNIVRDVVRRTTWDWLEKRLNLNG